MIALKKITGLLAIVSVLNLAGCLSGASDDDNIKPEKVFSYVLEELTTFFNTDEETVTLNRWFLVATNYSTNYDQWIQQGNSGLFKDEALTQKFQSSDMVKANTVIYSASSLNGQGPKIGTVTGTVKLADIPSEKVKLYVIANAKNWMSLGKVTLINPVEENKDLNWSFPVYDKQVNSWGTRGFEPSETEFKLLVLTETAQNGYNVVMPKKPMINSVNEDIGSLGTVSIKGVKLSGTINVTYKGQPVPYVEIIARWEVKGTLETIYLLSPGQDEPWSIFLDKSNNERDITFKVYGATKQDYAAGDIIIDRYVQDVTLYITDNDVQNITIDLGDIY